MKKKTTKSVFRTFIYAATAWVLVLSMAFMVAADTTLTTSVSGLTAVGKGEATWSAEDTSITGTAASTSSSSCGSTSYTTKEGTLTLTNTKYENAMLSFSYAVSNLGTVEVDGTPVTTNDSFSKILAKNETVEVYLKSQDKGTSETKVVLSDILLTPVENLDLTFTPIAGLAYTVDGVAVSGEESLPRSGENTVSYAVQSSVDGLYLAYAKHEDANGVVSTLLPNAEGKLKPLKSGTITPVFIADQDGDGIAPFKVGATSLWTWETAFLAAGTGSPVVVNDDYAMPTTLAENALADNGNYVKLEEGKVTYEIPAGAKLLVPYSNTDNGLFTPLSDSDKNYYFNAVASGKGNTYTNCGSPSAYVTLSIPEEVTLNCNGGSISLSSTMYLNNHYSRPTGQPISYNGNKAGHIKLDGNIVLNGGSNLYCYGYIYGDGKVTANEGAKVYEFMQIADNRGAENVAAFYGDTSRYLSFPFNQYYICNIESYYEIHQGAYSYAITGLGYNGGQVIGTAEFIGATGLFRIAKGTMLRKYDAPNDRMEYIIEGIVSLESIIVGQGKTDSGGSPYEMNSADFVLTINGDSTIRGLKDSIININEDISLMPGAQVIVEEGATCNISDSAKLYLYDKKDWWGFGMNQNDYSPKPYSPTPDRGSRSLGSNHSNADSRAADAIPDKSSYLEIKGTLNMYGNVFVTAGFYGGVPRQDGHANIVKNLTFEDAMSMDKVIYGTGTIYNYSAWKNDHKLNNTQFLHGAKKTLSVFSLFTEPAVAHIAGVDTAETYSSFAEGTKEKPAVYRGVKVGDVNYWIQHEIFGDLDKIILINGNKAFGIANGLKSDGVNPTLDSKKNNMVVSKNNYTLSEATGTFSFTVESGYKAELVNNTVATLSQAEDGTYTLSNVTGDVTIKVTPLEGCEHEWNDATCTTPKTCSVCGATEGEALGHTPAEAVIENEVAATCTADGSYDTVVYCSVCDAELSRVPTVIPATGHTAGEAVVENEVAATCTADGSYDTVVYCTVCDAELSRVPTVISATGHTAGEAVVENEVAATCTADGSYDTVVYCSVCDAELSRVPTTVPATSHTAAEAVVENEVAATCGADGSYDTVVYCSVCNAELSRETTTVPATGHTEGEAVKENEKAPSYNAAGSYDSVVYCSVCKAELSRETVSVPELAGAEASIGNTKYGTLEEALEIGGEVTLLAHIDADKAFEIKNPVVLNLNGFNVSATEKDTVGDGVFHVIAGGDLTIEGEGVINGASKGNNYSIAIWADGGKVTINGGTYTNVGAGEDNHYDLIYVKNGGEVVINGGTFIAQTPAWTLNSHDTSKGTITVYGGNFHDFNPCNSKAEGVGTNFCADGYCAVETEGVYTVQMHGYESTVTAPTCTSAGYTTHTCVGCNNSYVDNYVDALGHTAAEAVVENEVAATCGTDGSYDNVVYCTVCDAELSRNTVTVPATGHVNTTTTTMDATCTTDGSKTVTCACGEVVKTETIPATGHTAAEPVQENVVNATCTTAGSYDSVVYCSVCSTELSRETVPVEALGHNYVDGVCTVCGHTTLAPHIKITTDNMELGNSLALIFWVKKSEVKPDVNYYAVLTRTYADGMIDEVTVPMEEWKEVGNNYQIEYDNFAAKEMTDKISIQIFMSDGSIASNIFTDTIQEYAMYSIDYYKQFKEYSEFVTAMVDMLNYGAAAQIQFGYDTGDLANSKLTDEYQMLGTQSISPEDHWSNPQGKATSSNLELVSNIVLHIWFKEVTSDMYAVVSYTNHYGDLIEDTVLFDEFTDRGNGSYSVPVDELVVADGGQVVTCTLFYGDGSQFACCTESVESYIYIMTSYDLDTTGLYEATMKFVTSSYNYFH